MIEELTYEQLKSEYSELHLRVTRFSAVEQELINTRNRLDQELELYKRLQKYSSIALQYKHETDLLKLSAEAIVDILDIETAVVFLQNHRDDSLSVILTEGYGFDESLVPLQGEILLLADQCESQSQVLISDNVLSNFRLLSVFSSAVLVRFSEKDLGYSVFFLGAVSKIHNKTYAPILEKQIHVFNVFAQQMQSVLAKIVSNKKMLKQVETIIKSEHELRKLSMIATKTKNGVIISDSFGRIQWVNEAFTKITGYELAEVLGKKPKDFLQGRQSQPDVLQQLSEALWKKKDVETVLINQRKDGSIYYNQLEIKSVFDENGKHVNFIAIQKDITEEINHNQNVMLMNSRFKIITESTKMGIWDWNARTNQISSNEELSGITGLKDMNGDFAYFFELWKKNIHPDDKARMIELFSMLSEGKANSVQLEYKMFRHDNNALVYVKTILIAERNEMGELIRVLGGSQDVTAEKNMQYQLENALKERDISLQQISSLKNFYESILNHSPSQILVFDKKFNLTFSNTTPGAIGGIWSDFHDKAVSHAGNQLATAASHLVYEALKEAVDEDKMIQIEDSFQNENGRQVHFLRSILPSHDNQGEIENVIVIGVDITELKYAQSDILLKNEELKKINLELDHFVYSISHDLRSPLLSIKGLTSLVLQSEGISAENKKMLGMILTSATRLDNTIQEILEYSRNSRLTINLTEFDLLEMVKVVFDDLKYVSDSPSVLKINVNDPVMIKSDKARIGVLLKNIIGNSIKYRRPDVSPKIDVTILQHADAVKLIIEDNGEGIDEKHINKVFDMFYRGTTSSVGTGLGLYICREIVSKIGGKIDLESQLGSGTKVFISLPKQ